MTTEVSPILLAAGQSSRFGSDKLLHPLPYNGDTKPLILHTIQPWLDSFNTLNIVVRPDNYALITMLQNSAFASRLRLIDAAKAETGMSASLMSGIKALQQADAWLFGLADMPFIQNEVIQASCKALKNGAAITQPEFEGQRGHPVGFSNSFLPELLALSGDKGARTILQRYPDRVMVINGFDKGIYLDIDSRKSPFLN